jgi:hypothetical protein
MNHVIEQAMDAHTEAEKQVNPLGKACTALEEAASKLEQGRKPNLQTLARIVLGTVELIRQGIDPIGFAQNYYRSRAVNAPVFDANQMLVPDAPAARRAHNKTRES